MAKSKRTYVAPSVTIRQYGVAVVKWLVQPNVLLIVVTLLLVVATKELADIAEQEAKFMKLVEKPKANIDFLCPKLDEIGTGVTNVTFYNDGNALGHFTIRVAAHNMDVSLPPFSLGENSYRGCIVGYDNVTRGVLIGPKREKTYTLTVKKTGENPSFNISMKCQSELCIGEDITKSDDVLEFTCVYPEANAYPYPSGRTYPPEKYDFCGRER